MKSARIITTALAATALIAGSAQAMPTRDVGFYGTSSSQAAAPKLHKHAAKQPTTLALHIRRGPLAV